jgi:hypothetical protein
MNRLYIIGNGFDIYHGIRSKYVDFKRFLYRRDRKLHDLVEQYIPVDGEWSGLESALADIDIDSVTEYASEYLGSYAADGSWDDNWHDYQYEIGRIVEDLSVKFKSLFTEWVRQLSVPTRNTLTVCPLNISPADKFLTFNYTSTLSDIYGVPSANVLHIHGEAKTGQDLVLGHAWRPVDRMVPKYDPYFEFDSSDVRVTEGEEVLNRFFIRTFKDTRKVIADSISFFSGLLDLHQIVVLGHSMSEVDADYYREIAKVVNVHKVKWVVTFHGEDERARHANALKILGIPSCAVTLCEMKALQVGGNPISGRSIFSQ